MLVFNNTMKELEQILFDILNKEKCPDKFVI